jgi:putative regulator of septum formation
MIETPESGTATGVADKAPAPSPAPAAAPVPPCSPAPAPAPAPAVPSGRAPAGASPAGPRPRRRRLLIALVAATGAAAVVAAAVIAVLLVHRPPRAHVAANPLRATVFGLRPGQCFDSNPNGIAGAHAVPCARPHDGEIYGAFRVAGPRWPGAAALRSQAQSGCQRRLAGYLNPQLATSGLAETYAYPNQGAWAAGEHMVSCEIRGTQGKLTGSVRAAGG